MPSPDDRRYLASHEWHQADGDLVTIGLSRFAVDELTDITYVDFARTEGELKAGESFGEVESVKATSDIYCGVDGTIEEVNQAVVDNPAILNEDPFGAAWLIKVRAADPAQIDALLTAGAYDKANGEA